MRKQRNIYKRKDGRWEGRYFKEYDKNGKIKYGSVYANTYKEVKEKLELINSKIKKTSNKHITVDFRTVCYEWLKNIKNSVRQSTYATYLYIIENYLNLYLGRFNLYELDKNCFDVIIKNNPQLSQKTLKDFFTVFKSIIRFANENYNANITLKQYRFKYSNSLSIPVISVHEQKLLERFLLKDTDLPKLGILFCLYTGLRIGEICALKWSDIDLKNKTVKIDKTIKRIKNTDENSALKTKIIINKPKSLTSERVIPLPDFLIKLLIPYSKTYTVNSYFLSGDFNYIEPRAYSYKFKKYLEQAKVNNINFHALRHTFATRAIEKGIDVKSLSEILGHSTVSITLEKYVHPSLEQKRKQINKLNKMFFFNCKWSKKW